MANTEKPSTIAEKKKMGNPQKAKQILEKAPVKKAEKKEDEKTPTEKKKIVIEKKKRDFAIVNLRDVPISTKTSMAICRFIRGKKISKAIGDLELVLNKKLAVPMKGEIPHRKNIMSGRYPKKASEEFIGMLKSLISNSNENGIDDPRINKAIANLGQRPYGRFGRWRRKRTHVTIQAIENVKINSKKKLKQTKGEKK